MSKVLIACEESQSVCIQMRKKGIDAYSCDKKDCSGGYPEWHLKGCMFEYIKRIDFDLMIAFPPCTDLSVSGASSFQKKIENGSQQKSIDFFMKCVNVPIDKIAIENPIGIMSNIYRKPDQIIQPYFFGDPFEKRTCLWLKNLPLLYHNKEINLFDNKITHVIPEERYTWIDKKTGKEKSQPKWYALASQKGGKRGELRSKTFKGIAKAMAEQWGNLI